MKKSISSPVTTEEKALFKAVKKHLSLSHLNTLEALMGDRNGLMVEYVAMKKEQEAGE